MTANSIVLEEILAIMASYIIMHLQNWQHLLHIWILKKGRALCEVFGAYGWAEGLKLMKWLLDHMLVNGINYFVPHAFSMKDFPDPDCPPHFYARGMNPQFRILKI